MGVRLGKTKKTFAVNKNHLLGTTVYRELLTKPQPKARLAAKKEAIFGGRYLVDISVRRPNIDQTLPLQQEGKKYFAKHLLKPSESPRNTKNTSSLK